MFSPFSAATTHLFASLDHDGTGTVSIAFFKSFLTRQGLVATDLRLDGLFG